MSKGNSPAFPCQDNNKQIYTGMNLRDYFAIEAMHAIIDSGNYELEHDEDGYRSDNSMKCSDVAQRSYQVADAMLDERLKYK